MSACHMTAAAQPSRERLDLRKPERSLVLQWEWACVAVCYGYCLVCLQRQTVPPADGTRAELQCHLEGILRGSAEYLKKVRDDDCRPFETPGADRQTLEMR